MKKLSIFVLIMVGCIGLFAYSLNQPRQYNYVNDDVTYPHNLVASIVNVNDVLLFWDNPEFVNQPMGFRIYCNNIMVKYVTGSNITDYTLINVCPGCHQFYVTAYFDTGCETLPSNIAEVTITSNQALAEVPAGISLSVYPNPCRANVNIAINGLQPKENVALAIFNVRGQLIRQYTSTGSKALVWDSKDLQGKLVSNGIYYLKATTSIGNLIQKVIITR